MFGWIVVSGCRLTHLNDPILNIKHVAATWLPTLPADVAPRMSMHSRFIVTHPHSADWVKFSSNSQHSCRYLLVSLVDY